MARTSAQLSDFSGAWVGYAEAYSFIDGTDVVRLTLDEFGSGSFELGSSGPIPPPNAEDSYPPLDDATEFEWLTGPARSDELLLGTGFPYPVSGARVDERRIRMKTQSGAIFEEWCALQNATDNGGSVPSCMPPADRYYAEGACSYLSRGVATAVDCGKFLCEVFCQCNASGCTALPATDDVSFDGRLGDAGNTLRGTLVFGKVRLSVQLRRSAP